MRTLTTQFNLKVSVLKDKYDFDSPTKDEMYGCLTIYEMRIELKNISKKEVTFKSTTKQKFSKNECKNMVDLLNEENDSFVRN